MNKDMPRPTNTRAQVLRPFLLIALATVFAVAAPGRANAQQTAKGEKPPVKVRFLTPLPPYPLEARIQRWDADCTVRVQFDATGQVTSAVIVKTSGSAIIDDSATRWIRRHWKSLEGRPSTFTKELVYRLHRPGAR